MQSMPQKPKSSKIRTSSVWIGATAALAIAVFPACKPRQLTRAAGDSPRERVVEANFGKKGATGPLAGNPKADFRGTAQSSEETDPAAQNEDAMKDMAAGLWADKLDERIPTLSTIRGNKSHTLTVAAMNSSPRHAYFITPYYDLIDENQVRQVEEIVDSHDWAYEDLLQRRHQILEQHRDGELVTQLLNYNSAAILAVNFEIRSVIYRTVLTAEQRIEFDARHTTPEQDDSSLQNAAKGTIENPEGPPP
jgi:hypothetical protein